MALKIYQIGGSIDCSFPRKYYLCDELVDMPTSGLQVGELCFVVETKLFYSATSTTVFTATVPPSNIVPNGVINGSNATFTTDINFLPDRLRVFINGVRQKIVDDYNTVGVNTINFVNSPEIGDKILIDL